MHPGSSTGDKLGGCLWGQMAKGMRRTEGLWSLLWQVSACVPLARASRLCGRCRFGWQGAELPASSMSRSHAEFLQGSRSAM